MTHAARTQNEGLGLVQNLCSGGLLLPSLLAKLGTEKSLKIEV